MPTITCKLSPELDARLTAISRARRTTKSVVVKHVVGRLSGARDLARHPGHMDAFGDFGVYRKHGRRVIPLIAP